MDGYLNPIFELSCLSQTLLTFREYFDSDVGLKLLRGRLLSDGRGYASVRFEALVASTLKENGSEVNLRTFRGYDDFDILSSGQGVSVEIECKTQCAESGQRVKRTDLLRLVDGVRDAVLSSNARLLILLGCQDRLLDTDLEALSETISQRIAESNLDKYVLRLDGHRLYEMELLTVGLPSDPVDPTELQGILEQRQFENRPRIAVFGGLIGPAAARSSGPVDAAPPSYILCWSRKKNRPLTNLRNAFRDPARYQFSGDLPSVVCLHLDADVSWPETMRSPNVNRAFASAFLEHRDVSGIVLSGLDKSAGNFLQGFCTSPPLFLPSPHARIPLPSDYHFFTDPIPWSRTKC